MIQLLRSPSWHLFSASFIALYGELLFIRWLPLQIRLLAYYSNLILLSALLGFGIGLVLASRQKYRVVKGVPYFSAAFVLLVIVISQSSVLLPLASESNFVWNGLSRTENLAGPLPYVLLVTVFLMNTLLFVFLAHELGYWFSQLAPLKAYALDISGSLSGVLAFAAVSAFSLPPVVWFFVFGLLFFVHGLSSSLFRPREFVLAVSALAFILVAVSVPYSFREGKFLWSPYYEIQVEELSMEGVKIGSNIRVNKDSHQQALDLSGTMPFSFLESRKAFYELPYSFFEEPPSQVLVLGAGTGNDVAAAIRSGAESIEAVEIDPVIAKLGAEHPEEPYEDSRVRLVIDDARAYLERHDTKYDFITFGFLDSHRLFSSMSSIRLENYLYTVENVENIRERLNDGGILAIAYTVHEQWIADRIFHLLRSVFDQTPLVYQGSEQAWGTIFLVRKGDPLPQNEFVLRRAEFEKTVLPAAGGHTWGYSERSGFLSPDIFSASARLPTDDWPHLFLKEPGIPGNYTAILVLVFAFSFLLVRFQVPKLGFRNRGNWNFFFLGAGFALLETKGIGELALVLGSTWVTNAVVISGILVMILFANFLVLKRLFLPHPVLYLLLAAVLLFNFFFSFTHLFAFEYSWRVVLSAFQVGLPIFFSGILFSLYLRKTQDSTTALGANLLGAMFGGVFEYSSLAWGQSALFLFAIAFYALSFFIYLAENRKQKALAEVPAAA